MRLDYESLRTQFEALIVCDISGYGPAGPAADRKAYDLLIQAEAGFLSVTGTPEQAVKAGISIADIAAGTQAHGAILAALLHRHKTGTGCHLQVSLLDALVEWMGFPLYYAYDGAQQPARTGADHASIYPYGVFATGDGQQVLLGLQNEREWESFCRHVLERPALLDDARFVDNPARSSGREPLGEIIEACFAGLGRDEVCDRLDHAGIGYANINDMQSVWNHPQLRALERIRQIGTPAGPVDAFLPPAGYSTHGPRMDPVPALGQHTDAILRELGSSDSEIIELRDAGAV
jgi:crotonobetainyl-CoA:carnitine CoA-transferase CaiB-like acyl-CoA transferase